MLAICPDQTFRASILHSAIEIGSYPTFRSIRPG
jgi:hypothetical protein